MLDDLGPFADDLTAEGVRATFDPKAVQPPCALLTVVDVTPDSADPDAGALVSLRVDLVAPGPDDLNARAWLWDTAAPAAARVFGACPMTAETFGATLLPSVTLTATVGVQPWP